MQLTRAAPFLICIKNNGAGKNLLRYFLSGYSSAPSPPMSAVSSLMRSIGNGGKHSGFNAMLISFIGLSSAAMRFDDSAPHMRQRWTIAHSPFFLTQTAMGVHNAPAVRGSVARLDIDVHAREAIRAVISVLAARALRHCRASAHPANKSFVAGVGLVITFFVLFAFVFAIHFSSRRLSCGRTAECVLFADLPVSAHSPMIL